MGLVNTGTAGKKRKSEPQVGVSTPTQDAEQTLPPLKKKMKANIERLEPSQPTAMTTVTAMERNNQGVLSNKKRMNNGAKKHPTGVESDEASDNANPAFPAKKTKVNPPPIRRTGKIILMFEDVCSC